MTIPQITQHLRTALLQRKAEGFTIVHNFGSLGNKTCCLVSSIYDDENISHVQDAARRLDTTSDILWDFIKGFDNSGCSDQANPEAYAAGRALALEFNV